MISSASYRLVRWICLFLLCSHSFSSSNNDRGMALAQSIRDDYFGAVVDPLWERFETLPPKGKFATGAVAGFAATRMAVGTITKTVKVAGAAFVASEVMNAAGILDKIDLPTLSEEQSAVLGTARHRLVSTVNGFRVRVRKQLTPNKIRANIQSALQKERMATIGVATGAFVGFVV